MRRQPDLGAVIQDKSVDIAARRQGVLLDDASCFRKLGAIPERVSGLRISCCASACDRRGEN
jgi:hypothetical protein